MQLALSDAEIEGMKQQGPPGIEARLAGQPELREAHASDFLTWEQVREMGRSGRITFGLHGHRHALMTTLTRDEALDDIRQCGSLLKERVPDARIPVLAWPNGNARTDLDAELEAMGLRGGAATTAARPPPLPRRDGTCPATTWTETSPATRGLLPWLLMRAR